MRVRERFPGIFESEDRRLMTRNLAPGVRVGDEDLLRFDGVEFRSWDPRRSKLAAMVAKGARSVPFGPGSRVLYLGAANGATASHVSDIVGAEGVVYAVEFSVRSFRDLVQVAETRPNLLPILGDAGRPDRYARIVGPVDAIFQDIAQRAQGQLFLKNAAAFPARAGVLVVKARSVDVASDPRAVFEAVVREVQGQGHKLLERLELAPFERDHAALTFELAVAR
ncbi:MAG TPA: fibrillarin-like rRNA/tRNA 2'-O-methyltransferase [Candidatus Thermoplasmatota archaeon]|jgi:fibrillarin-like pre-rRNA processing protein|nr:fibrillarin-like rRNA/tRNA 2'-O-methyltransferase [Candidatus Thermoplasmatota archaeon]